jgi:hypothetical protein
MTTQGRKRPSSFGKASRKFMSTIWPAVSFSSFVDALLNSSKTLKISISSSAVLALPNITGFRARIRLRPFFDDTPKEFAERDTLALGYSIESVFTNGRQPDTNRRLTRNRLYGHTRMVLHFGITVQNRPFVRDPEEAAPILSFGNDFKPRATAFRRG